MKKNSFFAGTHGAMINSLIFTLCFALPAVRATSIKMDFLPVGHVRTDPIITQTCLSDHVHTFYGPQLVHPATTYDDLIATTPEQNTGNVEENKSLYWHPTVYSYDRQTNTYTRDEVAQSSAYYIWEHGTGVQAFPNGFRMIGGLDAYESRAEAECVGPSRCDKDDCYSENGFFPSTQCEELEVSMSFPSCWDGVNLDSDDHTSHVAYAEESDVEGDCPDSHPVKIPQIQLFFRIMPYDGGWHTFADNSCVYHADYVSGWDEDFLQDVIDQCNTDSLTAAPWSFCEDFLTFRDAPKCADPDENTCDFADPELLEKLQEIQPPPLDVTTVATEETEVVVGDLPRGTCQGELVGSSVTAEERDVILGGLPAQPRQEQNENCPPRWDEDDDDDDEGILCFSSVSTCIEETKGRVLVKDLNMGDKVLTRDGDFKMVYTIDHKDENMVAEFLQIFYSHAVEDRIDDDNADASHMLELTYSHMVFVPDKANPVAASQLKIGDEIETRATPQSNENNGIVSTAIVTNISKISRKGVWNPITTDGTIVVDGVVASTYSTVDFGNIRSNDAEKSFVSIAGIQLSSQHDFLHALMGPCRIVCMGSYSSICNQYYNGFNFYSYIGKHALEFARRQNNIIQSLMLLTVFESCQFFTLASSTPAVVAILAVLYYLFVQKVRK